MDKIPSEERRWGMETVTGVGRREGPWGKLMGALSNLVGALEALVLHSFAYFFFCDFLSYFELIAWDFFFPWEMVVLILRKSC